VSQRAVTTVGAMSIPSRVFVQATGIWPSVRIATANPKTRAMAAIGWMRWGRVRSWLTLKRCGDEN